jgi:hypothetical protein
MAHHTVRRSACACVTYSAKVPSLRSDVFTNSRYFATPWFYVWINIGSVMCRWSIGPFIRSRIPPASRASDRDNERASQGHFLFPSFSRHHLASHPSRFRLRGPAARRRRVERVDPSDASMQVVESIAGREFRCCCSRTRVGSPLHAVMGEIRRVGSSCEQGGEPPGPRVFVTTPPVSRSQRMADPTRARARLRSAAACGAHLGGERRRQAVHTRAKCGSRLRQRMRDVMLLGTDMEALESTAESEAFDDVHVHEGMMTSA